MYGGRLVFSEDININIFDSYLYVIIWRRYYLNASLNIYVLIFVSPISDNFSFFSNNLPGIIFQFNGDKMKQYDKNCGI